MLKKTEKLFKNMSELDDKYIEEAENATFSVQKPIWKKAAMLAACAVIAVGVISIPLLHQNDNPHEFDDVAYIRHEIIWNEEKGVFEYWSEENRYTVYPAGAEGTFQEIVIEPQPEIGDMLIDTEPTALYPFTTGKYSDYLLAKGHVNKKYIGQHLDKTEMKGVETADADVYEIQGIDSKAAVAIRYQDSNDNYWLFINKNATYETFSGLKNAYSMESMVYMGMVLAIHTTAIPSETSYHEYYDHSELKKMIYALDGTACTYDEFHHACDNQTSIGIALSHKAVNGTGKAGLQIFEEGYLMTNLDGGLRIFKIDEKEAKAIIDYAKASNIKDISFYTENRDIFEPPTYTGDFIEETRHGYNPDNFIMVENQDIYTEFETHNLEPAIPD